MLPHFFVEERGIETLNGKSDDQQLEEIKNFGADISIDIAAEQVSKGVFEFVKSVGGNIYENRIACKISDMLVQDDFANQVIKNVKSHMQMGCVKILVINRKNTLSEGYPIPDSSRFGDRSYHFYLHSSTKTLHTHANGCQMGLIKTVLLHTSNSLTFLIRNRFIRQLFI